MDFGAVWPAATFLFLFPFAFLVCLCWKRCSCSDQVHHPDHPAVELGVDPAASAQEVVIKVDKGIWKIPHDLLENATNFFSDAAKIGEGKFANVYKAKLPNSDKWVAIKKLKDSVPKKLADAFVKEVNNAGRLRHRYLVQLVGYTYKPLGQVLCIVFDYVPNGTLHNHLFDVESPPLSWEIRFNKIASGLAAGLDYLHFGGDRCLIHRDIKPLNVMLDGDFMPKIGDFGLSKLTDHGKSLSHNSVAGTPPYMAPEIRWHGVRASLETDVFSFGIVALQLATGVYKEFVDGLPFVAWVWSLYNSGQVRKAVDRRLKDNYKKDEATRLIGVGLVCCDWIPAGRPTMKEVISMLDGKSPIRVKPIQGIYKEALISKKILPSSATSTTQGGTGSNTTKVGNSEETTTNKGTRYFTPTASSNRLERKSGGSSATPQQRKSGGSSATPQQRNMDATKFSKLKPPLPP